MAAAAADLDADLEDDEEEDAADVASRKNHDGRFLAVFGFQGPSTGPGTAGWKAGPREGLGTFWG